MPSYRLGNTIRLTGATSLLAFVCSAPPAPAQPTPNPAQTPGFPAVPVQKTWPDIIDLRAVTSVIDGRRPVVPFFPPPHEWGPPVDGVVMSLKLDKERYRPRDQVFATINLKNRGTNAYMIHSTGDPARYEVICLTDDGEPAPQAAAAAFFLHQTPRRVLRLPLGGPQGGGHHFDRIDLSRYVDLARPGRYSVRIKTSYVARTEERESERTVTSNTVTFEIAEGGNDPSTGEDLTYPSRRGAAIAGDAPVTVSPLPILTPQTNRYPSTRTLPGSLEEANTRENLAPPNAEPGGLFDGFGREIPRVTFSVDPLTGRPIEGTPDGVDAVVPRSTIVFKGDLIGSFFDAGITPFPEPRSHLWGRPNGGVSVALAMDKRSYRTDEPITAIVHLKNVSNDDHFLPDIPPKAQFTFWAARNTKEIETPLSASVEQPAEPSPTGRLPFGGQRRETGRYAYGIQLQDFFDATQPGQYIVELRTRYLPADDGPAREVVSSRVVFSVHQPRRIPDRSTRP